MDNRMHRYTLNIGEGWIYRLGIDLTVKTIEIAKIGDTLLYNVFLHLLVIANLVRDGLRGRGGWDRFVLERESFHRN